MSALWVFIPVLGAPILHAPVLTFDLLKPLKRPLDLGATLGGRRLFGHNKTWRGALVMLAGVSAGSGSRRARSGAARSGCRSRSTTRRTSC